MPIKLLTPAEYLAGKKDLVLRNGVALTQGVVNGKPPALKTAIAQAAVEMIAQTIATDIEFAITDKLKFHAMMNGEWIDIAADEREAWTTDLETDVSAELDAIGGLPPGARLHEEGRAYDVAQEIAQSLAGKFKPLPMHAGKWLAGIGIAQPDIDKAEIERVSALPVTVPPATKAEAEHQAKHPDMPLPPPLPPVAASVAIPHGPSSDDFAAMFGGEEIGGVTGVSPPMPPAPVPPAAAVSGIGASQDGAKSPPEPAPLPPTAAPDKAAISRAFELWYECGGGGLDTTAQGLGISVGTLRNRCNGRTQGPVTHKQASFMRADIDKRIAALTEAATIFAAVR